MTCTLCHDSGLVHTWLEKSKLTKLYACSCALGERQRGPLHFPSDYKKERPYYLPVYGKHSAPAVIDPKPVEKEPEPPRRPYKDD